MRLTEEQLIEDDERWHARNVIHELEYCSRYIRDRRDITNLDLHFYMWLFRNALKMITAPKLIMCKDCKMNPYTKPACVDVVHGTPERCWDLASRKNAFCSEAERAEE